MGQYISIRPVISYNCEMILSRSFLQLLLILPHILANCNDKTCRSPTCCAEEDCSSNPTDPDAVNAQSCPCMISQTSDCVFPGASLILECDPGGVCQDHC